MPNKIFKLSMVAAALMAANSANAALYKIVPVDSGVDANQVFSSAISDSSVASATDPLGCFADSASCTDGDYLLGGDTRQGEDGISYRDEVPFKYDNTFTYLDYGDLRNYCYNQLGYSTCDSWAVKQWFGANSENDEDDCDYSLTGGLCQERRAFYQGYNGRNAAGFVDGAEIAAPIDSSYIPPGGTLQQDSANVVVNKVLADGTLIGIASSGYYNVGGHSVLTYRQRGFYNDLVLQPKQDGDAIVKQMGRTFAYDSFDYNGTTYVVGSASIAPFDNGDDNKRYYNGGESGELSNCTSYDDPALFAACQNFAFATQAYVWNSTDGTSGKAVSGWDNTTEANKDDAAAQASARTAAISDVTAFNGLPVLAGFNTYKDDDNYLMQAAIFYPKDTVDPTAENQWDSVFVQGAEVEDDDDYIYSNSLVKDINKNLIAIGEAKRSGRYPENGAANNRLFYTDASVGNATTKPTAVYLSGDIFFKGAGGEANAINNYNEVVGSIDAEESREWDGKQRRRRGFIEPLNVTGTDASRLAIFQGKSWWLDNLTNGGADSDANNAYRIVNATGINDDGVISATANYCAGGYDNTDHNSYCGDGSGTEELVAVKLIPIVGATADDIEQRRAGNPPVERKGGSLGYFALALLGLLGFRRKKIKS
ncbi:DUF3466 family protein [Vibrio algivorus]|uniref:DUF3466 family protein n=1 Tax=Vibrio algivorus TaxID=1667024 RepID=A0A557P8N9_9VIBR|nr:DUF3466 family protein [Vibrio algivorus]TVO36998.1 DUF3466 family protein [Vibrio algivorus]